MFLRRAVELFEVSQRHFACVFLLLFFEIRNQHPELRAPVADVVGADNFMAQEFEGANSGITNDG
ncbi:hypothetical protein D3C75_1093820 [compost metagenome]